MDDLTTVAEINGGYLMRHQLNDIGFSDALIRRAVTAGRLTRLRHGTYAVTATWRTLDESARHAVLTRSILDKLGPRVAATHQSAAALHGLDLYDVDLSNVHVTRLDGHRGRREAGVTYHEGKITDDDLVQIDGRLVVRPARAVFEACSLVSVEAGMVLASSAMRNGTVTREGLEEDGHQFDHWPGTRIARVAIRMADGRLESVGEVRSLHMMWRHGVPHPELQYVVQTVDGRVIARTDFAWILWRHTGEFDGLFKYGRLTPFEEPGQTVTAEKIREDEVRGELLGMSRWGWAGIAPERQPRTAALIVQGMEQSRKLYTRNGTTIVLG